MRPRTWGLMPKFGNGSIAIGLRSNSADAIGLAEVALRHLKRKGRKQMNDDKFLAEDGLISVPDPSEVQQREVQKTMAAAEAVDVTNRAHAMKLQQDIVLGAQQFFKEHPEFEGDADLIGVEVAKIQPDFSADPIKDTYRRLNQAAEKVRSRKARLASPDRARGIEDLAKTPDLPSNPKEEEELKQGWIDAHRGRQKKIRERWDL